MTRTRAQDTQSATGVKLLTSGAPHHATSPVRVAPRRATHAPSLPACQVAGAMPRSAMLLACLLAAVSLGAERASAGGQARPRTRPTHATPRAAHARGKPCLRGNVPPLLRVRVVVPELTKPHRRRRCAPRPRWAPSCSSAYATATPPTPRSGGAPTRALRRRASRGLRPQLPSHTHLPVSPQGGGASQQLVL